MLERVLATWDPSERLPIKIDVKHCEDGLMDFNGMSTPLGLFYAKRLKNKLWLYVYNYIFGVNTFNAMFALSGIVLLSYFIWYWSGLRFYFLV